MPCLSKEIDLFPEVLLSDTPSTIGEQWWALYTFSRQEKKLMRRLHQRGCSFCSPCIEKRSRDKTGRLRASHVPLFPSYVFLCGAHQTLEHALRTNCVSRFIQVPDGEELRRDLSQIYRLIGSRAPMTPEERLQPGDRVRIRSGPLAGIEGVLDKRRKSARLIVAVDFLRSGASVELSDFEVELI